MSNDNKNKKKIEDLIKEKELKKVDAEIARIEEERKKFKFERNELERKSNLHWYKRPLFIQAIIAGIVAVPLIWFYVKDVALPLSRRENIKLSKDIEERDQELIRKEKSFNAMKVEHERKEGVYIGKLKTLNDDYDKVESLLGELANKYESLSNESNGYKEKYAIAKEVLEKQKGEIEEKKLVISGAIERGKYISEEKAKLLYLDLDGLPQNYTNNQFEEVKANNGIVLIDHATNLMWEKSGSDKSMNYENAKKYIEKLNHGQYAGYKDWCLPTLKQAITLLEQEGDSVKLYIDPGFNKQQEMIWTSDKTNASRAWVVFFSYGHCYSNNFSYLAFVRAVRRNSRSHSGPWSSY